MSNGGGFINVDLEIAARTRAQLAPLIEQLEERMFELYIGRIRSLYHAHYESRGPASIRRKGRREKSPTAVIHELADAIEGLDTAGRRAWNAASIRDFNVGIEIPVGVWTVEHGIEADAIQRIAALQGRVVFTVYQLAEISRRRAGAAGARKR